MGMSDPNDFIDDGPTLVDLVPPGVRPSVSDVLPMQKMEVFVMGQRMTIGLVEARDPGTAIRLAAAKRWRHLWDGRRYTAVVRWDKPRQEFTRIFRIRDDGTFVDEGPL